MFALTTDVHTQSLEKVQETGEGENVYSKRDTEKVPLSCSSLFVISHIAV